ncbi:MAG: tRNA (cytidine(34)-2'-O)-methyltransferase [Eubacteriaceae bacterium]|nr:tRNA (cytidine(34)-2'-O)-methyltransferase [Eubacteriaceae bacterium]
MFNIVLYNPQIPQNTGNISRTCVVTDSRLHLIKPLGFVISDRQLKRAGLDYWKDLDLTIHEDLESFMETVGDHRVFLFSSKAEKSFTSVSYTDGDYLLFGSETSGVPENVHTLFQDTSVRIPMKDHPDARCLNLSNSVAVALYEALRQNGFGKLR